ncbi:MAG: hypothetical protein ACO3ZD_09595 [Cyanobium sp.]
MAIPPPPDPLSLDPSWPCPISLLPLEEALEQCVFRSGLSRQEWLKRLARALEKPALLPLLWLLPRGWRLEPAHLPTRLQTLAGVLERGLLTPTLLVALADDLPHLLPASADRRPSALVLWADGEGPPLPTSLEDLLALGPGEQGSPPLPAKEPQPSRQARPSRPEGLAALSGGLVWSNQGLSHEQSSEEMARNSRCARALNRLGANLLGPDPWALEGCSSPAALVARLEEQGWQIWAQLRCGVTSFGLGASLPLASAEGWSQVPLALPMRTGLLDGAGEERVSLLPHCCLEMEWRRDDALIRLQYYQGMEGLCGWEGLNDLQRPWQNDRHNGTLHYFGEPYRGEQLSAALNLCDAMALVHNLEATDRHLFHGGYGPLGLCIDSAALLQQGLEGRCEVFPVLLGGLWRERLQRRSRAVLASNPLGEEHRAALERYQEALAALPFDGFLQGAEADRALPRLRACQPGSSPFAVVGQLARP